MSKIRVPVCLFAIAASGFLAACGSSDDTTSESTTGGPVSLSDCTPDQLQTVSSGNAHRGHRQAGLPALLRGQRPDQRQGLRERDRLRDRRQARLHPRPGQVDRRAVQRLLRAGPEGLRLRRQPDLDHAQARGGGRLLEPVLRRPSRRSWRSRTRTSPSATSLADFEDANIGVQIGTTSLDAVNEVIQPCERAAGVRHSNDVVSALKNGQVDAVVVDVPTAFYLTAAQVPEATDRRPVPGPGRRPVGRAAAEGLAADRLHPRRPSTSSVLRRAAVDREKWMSDATDAPDAAVALRPGSSDGGPPRRAARLPSAPGSAAGSPSRRSPAWSCIGGLAVFS